MTQSSSKLPLRSEIPDEYKWRLEDIFENDEKWEEEYQNIKQMIPEISRFKGKLGRSAEDLLKALKFQDQLLYKLDKLYTYAHMRFDQDTTQSFYQALNDRAKVCIRKFPEPCPSSLRRSFPSPKRKSRVFWKKTKNCRYTNTLWKS